jgi:hypothetical protein
MRVRLRRITVVALRQHVAVLLSTATGNGVCSAALIDGQIT